MTVSEATVEIFWTAFSGLPKTAKESIIGRILQDPSMREDLIDIAIAESRRKEPARSFSAYLASRKKRG